MKRTEHKASFNDALAYLLLHGPSWPEDIGAHLWPDKVGYGPSRGGPSSCAAAASWMLGKMRRLGLVTMEIGDNGLTGRWEITKPGESRLLAANQQA